MKTQAETQRRAGDVVSSKVKGVSFQMIYCPSGGFWMGTGELHHADYERPRHRVKITAPFLIGQTQVTQALWQAIMGSNPSRFRGTRLPVETINWFDCVRFCNALSHAEGLTPVYSIGLGEKPTVSLDLEQTGYRLPTEAEWEYMAKAGTELTYSGSHDVDEVAWYDDTAGDQTLPVALQRPNAWGIYDCSGNVQEWCSDRWSSTAYQGRTEVTLDPHEWVDVAAPRAYRGGHWASSADRCRVASRSGSNVDGRVSLTGLRLLRRP